LSEMLSIQFCFSRPVNGMTKCFASQVGYAKSLISRFMEDAKIRKLGMATTPCVANFTPKPDDDQAGVLDCRMHNGGLWYLARGTRFDLLQAVGITSRSLDKWTRRNDRQLTRIYEYLNGTLEFGHEMSIADGDFETLYQITYVDADMGGCPDTKRSTTGTVAMVIGPNGSLATLDASARRQGSSAPSTPHAEVVAIDESLRRVHLPLLGLLEFALARPVASKMLSDATGAIAAVRRGGTKGDLQYMRIYPGVSFGFCHDFFYAEPRTDLVKDVLEHVEGSENHADMFTKALPPPVFLYHRAAIGIVKKPSYEVRKFE
jgi:hypothetical protein